MKIFLRVFFLIFLRIVSEELCSAEEHNYATPLTNGISSGNSSSSSSSSSQMSEDYIVDVLPPQPLASNQGDSASSLDDTYSSTSSFSTYSTDSDNDTNKGVNNNLTSAPPLNNAQQPASSSTSLSDDSSTPLVVNVAPESHRLLQLFHATLKELIKNGKISDLIKSYKLDYSVEDIGENIEPPNVDVNVETKDRLGTILKNKEVRIGAYKNKNWGVLGNYVVDPPTGFWPDLMKLVWETISEKFFQDKTAIKIKYLLFSNVFNALHSDEVDMTDMYFLSNSKDNSLRDDSSKVTKGLSIIKHSNKVVISKNSNITNFEQLKEHISKNNGIKIGCLSEANCNMFKDVFQNRVKCIYEDFLTYNDLISGVNSGTILAAIVSGIPSDLSDPNIKIFDSKIYTSHSPYFKSSSLANILNLFMLIGIISLITIYI